MIGTAMTMMDYNGTSKVGHHKQKVIDMIHRAEKLAMESADTISDIHGGGSPEAHRVTILRETDVEKKKKAAQRLAGIEG